MKAVLISIRPQWCAKICHKVGEENGKPFYEKRVEVRKTKPKIETPFKCYIYETQGRTETPFVDEEGHFIYKGRGQVIGEFVCHNISEFESEFWDDETHERITRVVHTEDWEGYPETESYYVAEDGEDNYLCRLSCLTWEDLRGYVGQDFNTFFGWHISDLKIYDKPRELSEFSKYGFGHPVPLKRPPQSWMYVEVDG